MFTIYGSEYCSFCNNAKKHCEELGIKYEYIDVFESEVAAKLFKDNNFRSVPQIYYQAGDGNIKHIGGFTDLLKFTSTLAFSD